MNPFKNVFKSRKSVSLDVLTSFVRPSKSASSISVETVDLDGTSDTNSSQWSTDNDNETAVLKNNTSKHSLHQQQHPDNYEQSSGPKERRPPVPPDIKPNWSALPLEQRNKGTKERPPVSPDIEPIWSALPLEQRNKGTKERSPVPPDIEPNWSALPLEQRNKGTKERSPVSPDIEPNWSALPLVTFSHNVFDAVPSSSSVSPSSQKVVEVVSVVDLRRTSSSSTLPYRNLVLVVIAELHQVLSLKLPRYMVALLSNYRYMNDSAGHRGQVEQMDLYLTNVQDYLVVIRNCDAHDYQTMLHHCGKTVAVLASIIELVGRNASLDVFLLSFQKQMISAFNKRSLAEINVKTQYLDYLSGSLEEDGDNSIELNLADSKTQTDPYITTDTSSQTSSSPVEDDDAIRDAALDEIIRLKAENASYSSQLDDQATKLNQTSVVLANLQTHYFTLQNHYEESKKASGDHSFNDILSRTAEAFQQHFTSFGGLVENFTEHMSERTAEMSQRINSARAARFKLSNEFIHRENYLKRLLQEIVARDAELSAATRQITAMKAELVGQDSEIGNLHRSLSTISEESVCHGTRNADLEAKIAALHNALQTEQTRSEVIVSENESLTGRVDVLAAEVDRRQMTEVVAEERAKALEERLSALKADLQDRTETLMLSQQENAALMERTLHLENTRGLVEGTQQAFVTAIKIKDDMLRKLQAALHAAISDGNDLQSDVVELKSQRKTNLEALSLAEEEKSDLVRVLSEKSGALAQLERFATSQSDELSKTAKDTRELETFRLYVSELKQELAASELGQSTRLLKESRNEVSESRQQLQNLKEKLAASDRRNKKLTLELTCLQKKFFSEKQFTGLRETQAIEVETQTTEECQPKTSDILDVNSLIKTSSECPCLVTATQTDKRVATSEANFEHLFLDQQQRKAAEELASQLKIQVEELNNVIRVMEYGKSSMILRIAGLEADNKACDDRIKSLEQQLTTAALQHSQDVETAAKENETKLRDALSRLAQKGEQLEFAKSNVEKLIRRQEDMAREVAATLTLKNQAERRIEQLSDQSSREIDELELQIKFLREQEHKNRIAPQKLDVASCTDMLEFQVVNTQTGLSFQFGYDLDSGRQICSDIFLTQVATKNIQTEWPTQPVQTWVQVSQSLHAVALQTGADSRNVWIQTDVPTCEGKSSQTGVPDCTNIGVQTTSDKFSDICLDVRQPATAISESSQTMSGSSRTVSQPIQTMSGSSQTVSQPIQTMSGFSQTEPNELQWCGVLVNPARHSVAIQTTTDRQQTATAVKQLLKPTLIRHTAMSVVDFPTIKTETHIPVQPRDLPMEMSESIMDVSMTEPLSETTGGGEGSLGHSVGKSVQSLSSEPESVQPRQTSKEPLQTSKEPLQTSTQVVPVTPPAKPRRTYNTIAAYDQHSQHTSNGLGRIQLGEHSTLHDSCQFVYDAMLKDPLAEEVLVEISNGLDYSAGERAFDQQFAEQFLRQFDRQPVVRGLFYRDERSNFAGVVSRLRTLVRTGKSQASTAWKYAGNFKPRNNASTTADLSDFFELIARLSSGNQGSNFDPKTPALKNGRLDADQFRKLADFNGYFAFCFSRIAPASRHLKQTFLPFCKRKWTHLSNSQRAEQFAQLALQFSRKSNKIRSILTYELNCDVEELYRKYSATFLHASPQPRTRRT
ncbi:hypothetical protein BV898_06784 [Hypsibius exemplaris]|uniref:Uncharacterized protein n=1 Tax=Hypsibius exemplaris TaxID=2072580 RepID=A0A1W0WVC4_HYPEX|nr:hypothetical protein BV898_06784 [Hypsibius exemplaris]